MNQIRMEKRKKVLIYTPVYDARHNALLGYLTDLTLKGANLASEEPIKIDRIINLAIEFRLISEKPVPRMAIPARVVWCMQEKNGTYYNAGLEFLLLTEQNRKLIEIILANYQFRH